MGILLKTPIIILNLLFGASILGLFIMSFVWHNNVELAALAVRNYMDYVMDKSLIKNYIL